VPALIGGNVLLETGRTFDVIRPDRADGPKVHSVVSCGPSEAAAAVDAAAAALPAWKATSFTERRNIFLKAADLLRQRAEEYTKLTAAETPLDLAFAGFEIGGLAIPQLEETAAVITQALKGEFPRIDASGKRELIQREPYGVVLGIVSLPERVALGDPCLMPTTSAPYPHSHPGTHLSSWPFELS
jgi:acyl-CoA reductase-like NAD-dependent aldehyde dehydrogenase